MSDDKTKAGGQDRIRINVGEPYELRDWAKKFNSTEAQVRDAVNAVGDSASDVERHLSGGHGKANAEASARAGKSR